MTGLADGLYLGQDSDHVPQPKASLESVAERSCSSSAARSGLVFQFG